MCTETKYDITVRERKLATSLCYFMLRKLFSVIDPTLP